MSVRRALGASLLMLATGCDASTPARTHAPADTTAGEIAMEWAGQNQAALLVPVHINGEGPFDFVLDTGATMTCVSEELANELDLPQSLGQIGVGVGIGGSGRMRLVRVDSLRVGAARAESMQVCALDLAHAQGLGVEFAGLLGLNFLRSFRVVLDFDRDIVSIHQPFAE